MNAAWFWRYFRGFFEVFSGFALEQIWGVTLWVEVTRRCQLSDLSSIREEPERFPVFGYVTLAYDAENYFVPCLYFNKLE